MRNSKRPHLKGRTTAVHNALADCGPGGAPSELLAQRCRISVRSAAQRLRWLQRVGFVRFVPAQRVWQLTDDSMFNKKGAM